LQAGLTMQEIANRHHISRERVRYILDKFGLWRRYRSKWLSGEPKPIPLPEDNIAGGKPWFFRRKKGERWWELEEKVGEE
jgi:transcriptional regulator with XRE-family HTH domain